MAILYWPGMKNLRRGMSAIRLILRVGIASGIQETAETGSTTLLTIVIAAMSTIALAAHQAVFLVVMVAFMPLSAIAETASVMAGQAVGAKQDGLVLRVARYSIVTTVLYTGVFFPS